MFQKTELPPSGLRPKHISDSQRLQEVKGAIARYLAAGYKISLDWIREYNQLLEEVSKNKVDSGNPTREWGKL